MAIDEIERTALVQQLISTLGEQPASTLMKCVVPDGADRVATKDGLRQTEDRLLARIDSKIETAIAKQTRTLMTTLAGFMLTIWLPLLGGQIGLLG